VFLIVNPRRGEADDDVTTMFFSLDLDAMVVGTGFDSIAFFVFLDA